MAIVEKDEEGARAKHVGLDTISYRWHRTDGTNYTTQVPLVARKTDDELRAQVYARFHQNLIAQDREAKERAAAWKRLKEAVYPSSARSVEAGDVLNIDGMHFTVNEVLIK